MYEERIYRNRVFSKFSLEVSFKESDLLISTATKIDKSFAENVLKKYYHQIEDYIEKTPAFLNALSPLKDDEAAPQIIKDMLKCAKITGIGPFASVAGAIALYLGKELLKKTGEVIVENGGDIFLKMFILRFPF